MTEPTVQVPVSLPTREQIAPLPDDARMDAYYYGFERTGVGFIDAILSAVAIAGKGAHHTESWGDPWEGTEYYFRGRPGLPDADNAVDLIQKAARQAADAVLALLSQPTPTAEDGPMPVSLPVSPGDLETSADAVRRVMREHDPGQLNADEVAWLDTGAHRLDQAAELLRQTFGRAPAEPPRIADMAPGTTFTAAGVDNIDRRWLVLPDGELYESDVYIVTADWLDPSTIRDVQPPEVTK